MLLALQRCMNLFFTSGTSFLLQVVLLFLDRNRVHQVPTVLRVDRKHLFDLAAQRLGFSVQTENTLQIGDEFITVISVANIRARASLERETKEFYGEFSSRDNLSIQSAYHRLLIYSERVPRCTELS